MENTKDILESLKGYKGVIYDFDGTIATIAIDWGLLKYDLEKFVLDKTGLVIAFTPLDEKLQDCKDIFGETFYQELLKIIADREKSSGLREVNSLLVDYICRSSQKQALFTMNTTDAIEQYIYNIFGNNPFDIVITKNTCLSFKPSVNDVILIADKMKLEKHQLVYIGDSDNDKLSANAANIDFYFV